jgi:hypothetical protein
MNLDSLPCGRNGDGPDQSQCREYTVVRPSPVNNRVS